MQNIAKMKIRKIFPSIALMQNKLQKNESGLKRKTKN
jgi:hypothetical protein